MNTGDFAMMMGIVMGIIVGLPIAVLVLSSRRDDGQRSGQPPENPQARPQLPQHTQPPVILIVQGTPYSGQRQPEQWVVADEPHLLPGNHHIQLTGGQSDHARR